MWINYLECIDEDLDELRALKQKHRHGPAADRLKMLRLLKSGQSRSQRQAAEVLGYSERQLRRWWQTYRTGGLKALLKIKAPGGSDEKMTPEAWAALEEQMKAGQIARLEDARLFLAEQFEIEYQSLSGISRLFRRQGVKLTGAGRPRHKKVDPEAQTAFKK